MVLQRYGRKSVTWYNDVEGNYGEVYEISWKCHKESRTGVSCNVWVRGTERKHDVDREKLT